MKILKKVLKLHHAINDITMSSLVAEALIEKVVQNVKPEQFECGTTILLIDLDLFVLPARENELLEREVVSVPMDHVHSGVLWHAAFGTIGMPMKRMAEFEGRPTVDRPLGWDGILRRFGYVRGLIVHYGDRFLGLAIRRKDTLKAIEFIERVCDDWMVVNENEL